MKTKLPILFLTCSLLLSACGGFALAAPEATATTTAIETASPLPPTQTAAPSLTPTVTPTLPPSPTPTQPWVRQGPDEVSVPILMYHHVEVSPIQSNYRVSAARFDEQLHLLHEWGYETITTTMLVDAIQNGADLPPRPVIITFDDGNLDIYTTAFPIMQKYGFTGVLYLVSGYIGVDQYMNEAQIVEMVNAGWEVGSHSATHRDLTSLDPEEQRLEIVGSREQLEQRLGVPVRTFSYPFGLNSGGIVDYVRFAGYIAGMGASGFQWQQGFSNLYVLQRCEIKETDIVTDERYFARFLPWKGDPPTFATNTPAPTNTPRPTETSSP